MKRAARALAVLGVLVAVGSLVVHAQDPRMLQWQAQAIEQQRAQAEADALAAQKRALAEQILQLRAQAIAERAPLDDRAFRAYWTDRLSRLPLEQLQALLAAGGAGDLNALTAPVTQAPTVTPAALGDSGSDLVFTKVAPCRIVDTRVAGGALPAGGSRSFHVVGTGMWWQGGPEEGCGIPYGSTAVAMNLTVTEQTGNGWLRAYPYGSAAPNASVINYGPTTWALANGGIQPICDPATTAYCVYDLDILAEYAATHVIIDVMGYFKSVDRTQYRTFQVTAFNGNTMPLPYLACANYLSVSISAPVAGRITVIARTKLQVQHTTGTEDFSAVGIFTAPVICGFPPGTAMYFHVPAALPTGTYYPSDTVIYQYEVTNPGPYTFYLNGDRSPTTTSWFSNAHMLATFTPN